MKDMKIIKNGILPFGKHYIAINLFGILFVKRGYRVTKKLINHEKIHSAQGRELLYPIFYILYSLEFMFRFIQFWSYHKAYRNISFEREAYTNESNYTYLSIRKKFAWIKYL